MRMVRSVARLGGAGSLVGQTGFFLEPRDISLMLHRSSGQGLQVAIQFFDARCGTGFRRRARHNSRHHELTPYGHHDHRECRGTGLDYEAQVLRHELFELLR